MEINSLNLKNTSSDSWPEIVELSQPATPRFEPKWLPPFIGDYVKALSDSLCVSTDMVGMAALSMLGICCQRKSVKFNKWSEPLCLYTLLIAEPGEKKSPVLSAVMKPLLDWQGAKNEELQPQIRQSKREKDILEKKIQKMKERVVNGDAGAGITLEELYLQLDNFEEYKELRLFVDDVTTEKLAAIMADQKESIALVSSEGGIFHTLAGRYSGGAPSVDLFLKAFNAEPCMVDRMTRTTVSMNAPKLSTFLSVQPHILKEVMSNSAFCGLGLVDRFLYILPESSLGKSNYRSPGVPAMVQEKYDATIKYLLEAREIQATYILSPEADELFYQYSVEVNKRMLDDLHFISGWAGKHCGIVGRIAAIIEASSTDNIKLTAQSMEKAILIGRYLIDHAKTAFDIAGADETIERARYVLKRLTDRGESSYSLRDILRLCQAKGIKTVSDLFEPLHILCDRGYVRLAGVKIGSNPGRPESERYEINPRNLKVLGVRK